MSLKYVNKKVGMKYSREDIDKTGAQYNIILSGRNAGKSYSIAAGTRPHELIDGYIPLALEKKSCVLGYVRRLEKETKGYMVEDDFSDKFDVIKKLSKGNYDRVKVFQGRIYFAKLQDDGKVVRAPWHFGKIFSMATANQWKSKQFPDIEFIVYEEFITDDLYLRNEPQIFMNLVSTIARDRNVHVYMLGNTVNRTCPYVTDWGLSEVTNQKIGSIDVYNKENDDGSVTKIAVEICENVGETEKKKSSMFFGKSREQITSSEWQTKSYPKLTFPFKEYELIYRVAIIYSELSFYACVLVDRYGQMFAFFYPKNGNDKKDLSTIKGRKICAKVGDSFLQTDSLLSNISAEKLLYNLYKSGKARYANDLCGTDIEQNEKINSLLYLR